MTERDQMLHRGADFSVRIGKHRTDAVQRRTEIIDHDKRYIVLFMPSHCNPLAGNHDRAVKQLIVQQLDMLIGNDNDPAVAFPALLQNLVQNRIVKI